MKQRVNRKLRYFVVDEIAVGTYGMRFPVAIVKAQSSKGAIKKARDAGFNRASDAYDDFGDLTIEDYLSDPHMTVI